MFRIQRRVDNIKRRKGQAIVELALALPIVAILLCAIVDFGRVLYAGVTLNMVSQEAARKASLGSSDHDVELYVWANSLLNNSNTIDVDCTPELPVSVPPAHRSSGTYVTVTLKYNVQYITPLLKVNFPFIPSPFLVISKSTIRLE